MESIMGKSVYFTDKLANFLPTTRDSTAIKHGMATHDVNKALQSKLRNPNMPMPDRGNVNRIEVSESNYKNTEYDMIITVITKWAGISYKLGLYLLQNVADLNTQWGSYCKLGHNISVCK